MSVRASPFQIGPLLGLCSNCPRLRKAYVKVRSEMLRDGADQVTSLESLEEFDCACSTAYRVLPYLKLPLIKRLRVTSALQEGRTHTLADLLPCGGRTLLALATRMIYFSDQNSQNIDLSGEGIDLSLAWNHVGLRAKSIDWFFGETRVPFEQIEELEVQGYCTVPDFPIHLFENLTTFHLSLRDVQFTWGFFQALIPGGRTEIPCPSLRKVEITYSEAPGPYAAPLVFMVRKRGLLGHRLELLRIFTAHGLGQGREEELREHVGELQVE